MGDFDESVPSNYFDVVFSISVVEHVLNEKVEPFFADCCRILKPGGMMAHAIDVYIFNVPGNLERLDLYRSAVETAGLEWVKQPKIDRRAIFKTCFASNSDATMGAWNKIVPTLRSVREEAQSVSVKLLAFKKKMKWR